MKDRLGKSDTAVTEREWPAGPFRPTFSGMHSLIAELADLRRSMRDLESASAGHLVGVDPAFAASARNLVHYLAMRGHDVRGLDVHPCPAA